MFSEAEVTEIYFMADDFCKEFTLQQEEYMVEDTIHKHRDKPNRMNDAEITVILILFYPEEFRCYKHYYKEYVCKHLTHFFPHRVSYNRFVGLEPLLSSVTPSGFSHSRVEKIKPRILR